MNEIEGTTGRTAIVTGGSRGIGLAICRALAADGLRVAVIGRDGERAREAANALAGQEHEGYACDVGDPDAARTVVQTVEERQGAVSVLVNNAGITRDNVLARLKDEDWDEVIDTNLKGSFNMTRAVARGMMKRRDGVILNISSVVGLMGNAGQSNYAASKAGLLGFTKSVARELASRNVRCNAIAPGFIRTDMTSELSDEVVDGLTARIPLGRLGEPEDVAELVRFLVSPQANYITGQVVIVDGGMVM